MIDVLIPRENANDDSVLITEVKVSSGAFVEKGTPLFEFETSKATFELEAPLSGYIWNLQILSGQIAKVDSVVCTISDSPTAEPSQAYVSEKSTSVIANLTDSHLSDAARKLLESGQQPREVSKWISSASFGEIGEGANVARFLKNENDVVTDRSRSKSMPFKSLIPYSLIEVDRRKRLEISALSASSTYLNSTLGIHIKIGSRRVDSAMFGNSILDLVLYESYNLLRSLFFDLNRYYFDDNHLGEFKEVRPGYALDNGSNLTVLNVGVFSTLRELEDNIIAQITRYEEKKLLGSDLTPTTFTVTDLSSTDVDFMLPLVNGHQTFILGIVRADFGFKVYGTFDHRVTEGRRFAEFLGELRRRILLFFDEDAHRASIKLNCFACEKSLQEEKSLGNRGFIKIDDGSGTKLLCRNCFDGY